MTALGPWAPLLDLHPPQEELRAVALRGLRQTPKTLPCRLLYDARGCALFVRICSLPEYYLTRCEIDIMREHVDDMAERIGGRAAVIEFGSGSGVKSRLLLEALADPVAYIPVDIAREMLVSASRALRAEFPRLEILPVCADYTQRLRLPQPQRRPLRRAMYFPGSTIGNFHVPEAERFLRRGAELCGVGAALLIGVDLKKDRRTLEAAYDDAAGVTAEFNLNILARLNRELGADFDLDRFAHRAVWNEPDSRMEIYAVSRARQQVRIGGFVIEFARGETVLTECSYKYTLPAFARLARRAGYRVERVWTDERRMFSVQCLVVERCRPAPHERAALRMREADGRLSRRWDASRDANEQRQAAQNDQRRDRRRQPERELRSPRQRAEGAAA